MKSSWAFFLSLTLGCLLIQAFFAMLEMAAVSFNKVRLQYYVSKNHRRAKWLSYLLNHPAKLFWHYAHWGQCRIAVWLRVDASLL